MTPIRQVEAGAKLHIKKSFLVILVLIGLFQLLAGCGSDPERAAYWDGYEGREMPWLAGKRYREWYEIGRYDAWCYNQGYKDGGDGSPPNESLRSNSEYRRGYRTSSGADL